MELLIAFLIAFGVVTSEEAKTLSKDGAAELVTKKELDKDYIIWEAEADDF